MIENKKAILTKGRILKNEMLETMRDFPINWVDIMNVNQADGVLTGLSITADDKEISVSKGLIKYEGEILVLSETLKIHYEPTEKEQILKVRFHEPYEDKDFSGRMAEVVLDEGYFVYENEIELARYRLSEGAYLRIEYKDLEDFKTGHNTLNLVHQPYSSITGISLNPEILTYFSKELLTYQTQNPYDVSVIFQVLNQVGTISRDLLVSYLKIRLNQKDNDFATNEDIHKGLIGVLKIAKSEQKNIGRAVGNQRRLIVD